MKPRHEAQVLHKLAFTNNGQAIILVGGVRASEYLCETLQKESPGIQVMQPRNA